VLADDRIRWVVIMYMYIVCGWMCGFVGGWCIYMDIYIYIYVCVCMCGGWADPRWVLWVDVKRERVCVCRGVWVVSSPPQKKNRTPKHQKQKMTQQSHENNPRGTPQHRAEIKRYSAWPTIPQLYLQGEFVGGAFFFIFLFLFFFYHVYIYIFTH
jgi:hypothetical protein